MTILQTILFKSGNVPDVEIFENFENPINSRTFSIAYIFTSGFGTNFTLAPISVIHEHFHP